MPEGTTAGVTVTLPITFEQQVWVSVTAPLSAAGWQRLLEVLAFLKAHENHIAVRRVRRRQRPGP